MNKTVKMRTEKINRGIYKIIIGGNTFEAEDFRHSNDGKKPDWNLFESTAQGREWINDFPTFKACKAAALRIQGLLIDVLK